MYTINIKFEDGRIPVSLKKIKTGTSLLEVCLDNGVELQHDCGGICSCTTCHLYIEKGIAFLEEMSRREMDILLNKNKSSATSRLGCQCLLLDGSGEIEIIIPAQAIKF